jgi:chemotaxis regulatin CheY-phosphate phosphatase CheZ
VSGTLPDAATGTSLGGAVPDALQAAATALREACADRLPAIASTLAGLINATEVVAQKVLDEADQLATARDRLCRAFIRLRPFIAQSQPGAGDACQAVADAVAAISARIEPIVTSMEFQDLTAQHLRAGIEAIEEIRGRLGEFLNLMHVVITSEPGASSRVAAKVGAPAVKSPWRQALADELINERTRGE